MTPHLFQPLLDMLKSRSRAAAPPVCRQPLAHPVRDWTLLVLGAVALLIVCIAVATALYVWDGSAGAPEAVIPQGTTLNVQKLEDTLSRYRALAAERARLLSAPPSAADPAK